MLVVLKVNLQIEPNDLALNTLHVAEQFSRSESGALDEILCFKRLERDKVSMMYNNRFHRSLPQIALFRVCSNNMLHFWWKIKAVSNGYTAKWMAYNFTVIAGSQFSINNLTRFAVTSYCTCS